MGTMKDKNSPQLVEILLKELESYFVTRKEDAVVKEIAAEIVEKMEPVIATREAEGLRDFAKKVSPIRDEVGWHITPKQVQLIEETAKGKDSNG